MEEKKQCLKDSLTSAVSHQDLNTLSMCFAKKILQKAESPPAHRQ